MQFGFGQGVATVILVGFVLVQSPGFGDDAANGGETIPLDKLPEVVRNTKTNFRPIEQSRIIQRRRKLREAQQQLDGLLSRWSQRNRDNWKRYLEWSEIETQLEAETEPDVRFLQRMMEKMRINHRGLERPQFMALRDRIRDYHNAVYFSKAPNIAKQFESNMDQLAKRLASYSESSEAEDASFIGRTIGWLDSGGQAREVVHAVRRHYTYPNLYAEASSELLSAGIAGPVDRTVALSDNILGVSISGTAATTGRLDVELIPNDQQATVNIVMTGTSYSNTVGYRQPVTLYSVGTTSIYSTKPVVLDETGFHLPPASASCVTNSTITNVCARCRLVQRIAWRRAQASSGEAEYVAARHAEYQVASNMDSEAAESFEKPRNAFDEKFRRPLLRRGEFPRRLQFSTTQDALKVKATQANTFQIAAAGPPPNFSAKHDLGLRVHSSLVSNFSEGVLGGEKMTDEQLAQFLKNLTGRVPEGLEPSIDKDPWSITFARVRPISAEFRDQQITLTIRGDQFTRGPEEENRITADMYISATYKLEQAGSGSKLTRIGEVVVEYTKKGRQSVSEISFKTFMKKNFEALFRPEIIREGIVLPGRFADAGTLQVDELTSTNDWLVVGWNKPVDAGDEPVESDDAFAVSR